MSDRLAKVEIAKFWALNAVYLAVYVFLGVKVAQNGLVSGETVFVIGFIGTCIALPVRLFRTLNAMQREADAMFKPLVDTKDERIAKERNEMLSRAASPGYTPEQKEADIRRMTEIMGGGWRVRAWAEGCINSFVRAGAPAAARKEEKSDGAMANEAANG